MWITKVVSAHVLRFFAKIGDDENLSAFYFNKDMEGLTLILKKKS